MNPRDPRSVEDDEKFQVFSRAFRAGLHSLFQAAPDETSARLDGLMAQTGNIKEPKLSKQLIIAICEYKTKEHKAIVIEWFKNTDDINAVDEEGNTVFYHAAVSGRYALLEWMLKKENADVNSVNKKNESCLTSTISKANENNCSEDLRLRLMQVIEVLLKAGARNVAQPDKPFQKSALGIASLHGDLKTAKMLVIDYGFSADEGDIASPSWYAENSTKRNETLIAFLAEHSSNAANKLSR